MADEAKIYSILRAAKFAGFLVPYKDEKVFLHPTANKANKILYLLSTKADKSCTTEEISINMGLSINTTRIILRSLVSLNFCDKTWYANKTTKEMTAVWTLNLTFLK